jgi:multiple sugar transport system substrate-binding protein
VLSAIQAEAAWEGRLDVTTGDQDKQTVALAEAFVAGRMTRRTFITRMLALGLTTSAAGAILAACSSSTATSAPATASGVAPTLMPSVTPTKDISGEVRELIGPWTDQEADVQAVMQEAFYKLFPNVKIKMQMLDWDTEDVTTTNGLKNGTFDVCNVNSSMALRYSPEEDLSYDISDRVNDPAYASEKAHFANVWDLVTLSNQPRFIGIPSYGGGAGENPCWFNLDLLEAGGFKLDDIAMDEGKFADALIKITKAPGVYGTYFGDLGNGDWYPKAILNAGHTYFTPDGKDIDFDNADVLHELQWLVDLHHGAAPQLGTYDYSTVQDAWLGQKIAMMPMDPSIVSTLQKTPPKFRWAVVHWAPGPKGDQFTAGGVGMRMIAAKAANKDACWEWIKFVCGPWASAYWCDKSGATPARDDAFENGYGKELPTQFVEAMPKLAKAFKGWPVHAKRNQVRKATDTEFTRILSKEVTVEEGLKNAAAAARRVLAES